MLGLGRALGETMAVTFVIGNAHGIPTSLLRPGSTISSTIANEFTEAIGELHPSSLIALGLVLFVITFAVLALAKLMLLRLQRKAAADMTPRLYAAPVEERRCDGHCWVGDRDRLVCAGLDPVVAAEPAASARLDLDLFTKTTPPPGSDGGLLNAISGARS